METEEMPAVNGTSEKIASRFVKVSFADLQSYASKLSKRIIEKNGKPEWIVHVGRGGMVFARLMSDFLDVGNVIGISASYYSDVGKRKESVEVGSLPVGISGTGYILLVDDVADSGNTLNTVLDKLSSKVNNKIVTCTSAYKTGSVCVPDFYALTTDKATWIIFEYEVNETLNSFVKSSDAEGVRFIKENFTLE